MQHLRSALKHGLPGARNNHCTMRGVGQEPDRFPKLRNPLGWYRWALRREALTDEARCRLAECVAQAVRQSGSPGLVWHLFHSAEFRAKPTRQGENLYRAARRERR